MKLSGVTLGAVGCLVYAVYGGACLWVTWWAIDWVADLAGIHLKLLGAALALIAAAELGCGIQMLFTGLLVGLVVLIFTDTADPFAFAKVGGIGLAVGIGFRLGWMVFATVVAALTQRLGRFGGS